jgi:hypothetical protein
MRSAHASVIIRAGAALQLLCGWRCKDAPSQLSKAATWAVQALARPAKA